MTDLMRYAAALSGQENAGERSLPPVGRWDPPYCGELDLIIKRDGTWIHEGTPIGRARLVRLFSTVIKKEDGKFFLVTPVEKLGIVVEDAPFTAVLMRVEGEGRTQKLIFTTNVGDEVEAGPDHAICYRLHPETGESAPYIHVRASLEALIARSVFYDLVALGETRQTTATGLEEFGVVSNGAFFSFGDASKIFDPQGVNA